MSSYNIASGSSDDRQSVSEQIYGISRASQELRERIITAWVSTWRSSPYADLKEAPTAPGVDYPLGSHVNDATRIGKLGSDRGGSLRNPAHYCGIYAHKPTYGIVPMRSGSASDWIAPSEFTVAGPLARTAHDLKLELDVIAGADPMLMSGWSLNLPKPTQSALRDFRIAAWLDDKSCLIDSAVLIQLNALVDALRQAGAQVDEAARPTFDSRSAYQLYTRILRASSTARLSAEQYEALAAQATSLASDDNRYSAHAIRGAALRHRNFVIANNQRAHIQRRWLDFFNDFDILLAPIEQTAAFPHNHEPDRDKRFHMINGVQWPYGDHGFFSGMPSLANLPSTVAPIGLTSDGLPVGVQVIGREYADHTTMQFAKLLAEEIGGFQIPPIFRA